MRSALVRVAEENQVVFDRGWYHAPSGGAVSIRESLDGAVAGTKLFTPAELAELLDGEGRPTARDTAIEVVAERTGESARRIAREDGVVPLALNFASAKNPGGGYLRGAKAQEEDLSRCSGLYPALMTQPRYYEVNRKSSLLYTDHMIHSPAVPFFRDEDYRWLEEAVPVSIVTAPAPNAGELRRRDPEAPVEATLRRRAGMALALAAHVGARHLILGAWGCGVFGNDPELVADAFGQWLAAPRFVGRFARIVFAVHDRKPGIPTLRAFERRFGGATGARP